MSSKWTRDEKGTFPLTHRVLLGANVMATFRDTGDAGYYRWQKEREDEEDEFDYPDAKHAPLKATSAGNPPPDAVNQSTTLPE